MKIVLSKFNHGWFKIPKEFFNLYAAPYKELWGAYVPACFCLHKDSICLDIHTDPRMIEYIETRPTEAAIELADKYFKIVNIPEGTKYYIDSDENGIEKVITEDDIEWGVAK